MQVHQLKKIAEQVYVRSCDYSSLILTAEPGTGKTVFLPFLISEAASSSFDRPIYVVEPRAAAAVSAARFVAHHFNLRLGREVGYLTGDMSSMSRDSKVVYVTDGVLVRMLAEDPLASFASMIILDEFHERSVLMDVAYAMIQSAELLYGEEFKLRWVITSATLDGMAFVSDFRDDQKIHIEGRRFDVSIEYRDIDTSNIDLWAREIANFHGRYSGSTLAFCASVAQIQRLEQALPKYTDAPVAILHGRLAAKAQIQVINPRQSQQRIILATNIAEASLTVADVTKVVDQGRRIRSQFDRNTRRSSLQTDAISKASAIQRAGRAGRVSNGHVLRLWSEDRHATLYDHEPPDILFDDLLDVRFIAAQWGASSVDDLVWLTPPHRLSWESASQRLERVEVLASGELTELGRKLRKLPVGVFLAFAWYRCQPIDRPQLKNVLVNLTDRRFVDGELSRFNHWDDKRSKRLIDKLDAFTAFASEPLSCEMSICTAMPEFMAKRRGDGLYETVMGERLELSFDGGGEYIWVPVLNGKGQLRASSCLSIQQATFENVLIAYAERVESVSIIDGALRRITEQRFGAFVIERSIHNVSTSELRDWMSRLSVDDLLELLTSDQTDELDGARRRLALVEGGSKATLIELLRRYADSIEFQLSLLDSLKDLTKASVARWLIEAWELETGQRLDDVAPLQWASAIGVHAIRYEDNDGEIVPTVSLPIQAVYGTSLHPMLGLRPICFHLQSPARRTIQITSDLPGFWKGSYKDVAKDMRSRYPKHHWPQDPVNADAMNNSIKKR